MLDRLAEADKRQAWCAALIAAEVRTANPRRRGTGPVRPHDILPLLKGSGGSSLEDDHVDRLARLATGELLPGEIDPQEAN